MSRRAVLGLLVVGAGGAAGVQGTGAFSSIAGDREFSVATAADENALLGIEPADPTGDSGGTVRLFTLTNRFDETLVLDRVGVRSSGSLGIGRSDLDIGQRTLGPGEATDIAAELSCSSDTTDDVEIGIRAATSDRDASVELARSTSVTCEAAASCLTGPEIGLESETVPCIDVGLRGGGDVAIEAEGSTVDGDATVTLGGGGEVSVELEGSRIRGDLRIEIRGGVSVDLSLENSQIDGAVRIETPGGAEVALSMEGSEIGGGVSMTLGGGGEVALSMENSEIGDDTEITTGGGSEVGVEMEGSAIRGDLTVDARGGSEVEVETEDSVIEGDRP
ncbi:hypothetical protein HPS36_03690 [Halorubrum salinarum]|uniref:Uncharacterized protein n=1 Tax=Halorubrum salinarum TaxID=2739057 RepID=A0A7D4BZV2_9EURY|nr:hypothetical protein [Halorubrum salinarum]QKG91996.1 hypothetical protein HPS36_03690 [Halorubrum salinarum]